MSSYFDAVGCQERVELTTRFLVELQDYLNEAVAALLRQRVSEIGGDFIRLLIIASAQDLVLPIGGGPKAATEKVWSQGEGRQQSQRKEAFCSINQCHRRHSPSEVFQSGQTTGAVPCAGLVPNTHNGVRRLHNNNLTRFEGKLGRAKRLIDPGKLTRPAFHFDRIAACFRKRLRSTAIACGDAILKTASRMFTLRNVSSKRWDFASL